MESFYTFKDKLRQMPAMHFDSYSPKGRRKKKYKLEY